jgi:hypothetical protein
VRLLISLRLKDGTIHKVGTFTASPEEMKILHGVLSRHRNPFDALSELPRGLLWDVIDSIRAEGHDAVITPL